MNAIIVTGKNTVELTTVLTPEKAQPNHLLIKMQTYGINAGDIAFINGVFPPGFAPSSQYNIAGVSGVGRVLETGAGVPGYYKGKNVLIYRSLQFSNDLVGVWSDYAHLPYLQCAVLPDNVEAEAYAGSLVNIITPYAFLKQAQQEGHVAMIATAGNSATGIALLGIAQVNKVQVISIVRDEKGKQQLQALGAQHVLVQTDADFKKQLQELSQQLKATAVFDGVGGALLNTFIDVLPPRTTIYAYGFLGGPTPLSFHTSLLMRGLTIKGFSNFGTPTVQDPQQLEAALKDISTMIHMPHFTTPVGQTFAWEQIREALAYAALNGGKAVFYPKTAI